MTSSKMEAEARYKSRVIKQCKIDLNRNTDGDIIAWLEGKDNRQGYIKRLIREDMAATRRAAHDAARGQVGILALDGGGAVEGE